VGGKGGGSEWTCENARTAFYGGTCVVVFIGALCGSDMDRMTSCVTLCLFGVT
jgi:hypothetical protein